MNDASPEQPDDHRLSREEQRAWDRLRKEPNTYDDWLDLNETVIAYKRRRIARHLAKEGSH